MKSIIFSSTALITNVDCGSLHTALVTCKFSIFVFFSSYNVPKFNYNHIEIRPDYRFLTFQWTLVNGSVYCFGDNTYNQLGKKNTVDGPAKCNRPERIKFPSGVKIKTVSCGAYHTAAVSGIC